MRVWCKVQSQGLLLGLAAHPCWLILRRYRISGSSSRVSHLLMDQNASGGHALELKHVAELLSCKGSLPWPLTTGMYERGGGWEGAPETRSPGYWAWHLTIHTALKTANTPAPHLALALTSLSTIIDRNSARCTLTIPSAPVDVNVPDR